MEVKTFEAQYELIEFNLYMDSSEDKDEITTIVDLVIKFDNIDFIKNELSNIFIVDNDNVSYVLSGYKIKECYKIGDNLIRTICVK